MTSTTTLHDVAASMANDEHLSEKHATAIANLTAFMNAVQHYTPGEPGSGYALQETMRSLKIPKGINQKNAVAWAQSEIQKEQQQFELEQQKEKVFAEMKDAERTMRLASKTVTKARKAWLALQKMSQHKTA